MGQKEEFSTFLKYLCNISDQTLINNILKECKSYTEFMANKENWSNLGLNIEQVKKILKIKREVDKGAILAENDEILRKNFPNQENDEEDFLRFCKDEANNCDKIPEEILRWVFKNRSELLFKQSALEVAIRTGSNGLMNTILPMLAKLAEKNPGYFEIFSSSGDELIGFLSKFKPTADNILKGNAISSIIMFGSLSLFSFVKHFKKYYQKKRDGKNPSFGVEVWKPFAIDTAANAAVSITAGITGAIFSGLFTLILGPGLGTFIGGIIGSILGALLGNLVIDPLVKKYFSDENSANLSDLLSEEDLYKLAIEKLGLNENCSKEDFKRVRKSNFLAWHPDKHNNLNEKEKKEYEEKLIQLEFYHKTIKNYRIARNQW